MKKTNRLAIQLTLCCVLSVGADTVSKDILSQKQKAMRTLRPGRRTRDELAEIWTWN